MSKEDSQVHRSPEQYREIFNMNTHVRRTYSFSSTYLAYYRNNFILDKAFISVIVYMIEVIIRYYSLLSPITEDNRESCWPLPWYQYNDMNIRAKCLTEQHGTNWQQVFRHTYRGLKTNLFKFVGRCFSNVLLQAQ